MSFQSAFFQSFIEIWTLIDFYMKIILHCGYPKAASSAIQELLDSRAEELKSLGILYPKSFRIKEAKHEGLFRLVRLNRMESIIKALKKEVLESKEVKTVLLSTESVVNQIYSIDESRWRDFFGKLKEIGDLELVVVVRNSQSFLKSCYKQAVINQSSPIIDYYGSSLTYSEFQKLPSVQRLADSKKLIDWLGELSCAPVKCFDYCDQVVEDFYLWLTGLPSNSGEFRSNSSMEAEEVEFVRRLNAVCDDVQERCAWLHLLLKVSTVKNATAITLAGRANSADLLKLDSSILLRISQFSELGIDIDEHRFNELIASMAAFLTNFREKFESERDKVEVASESMGMRLKDFSSSGIEKCLASKVKYLMVSDEYADLGKNLYTKNMLRLPPFEHVRISGWGQWEEDPFQNRSWQWRLNWLSFLPYLIAFHKRSQKNDVLNFALNAIESWLDNYLETDESYPFEFVWHDHATALRAEQLAFFVYYCREFSPHWTKKNENSINRVENAIVKHAEWLSKDDFYSAHTNHGLEQARVLLLLGTIFEGEKARAWQKLATRRIKSELDFSFTTEGVHVENSPAYHIFVFKVFLGILKDYPSNVLGDLAEQFEKFSAQALGFITHILRPDGTLPPIGDTEQLPTSDAYREMFGHTIEYQHFLYAVSQGKQGLKPAQTNRVYAKSGYAVFRDCWPESAYFSKAFHIIAKVGCSSRYHHQQDEGHISIYAGGEDWLIDSGLYNYINKDPIRKYMRGRVAHNVPIISNARYSDDFEHRLSAWSVQDCSELEGSPYVSMQLDVMPPVAHQRCLQFDSHSKIIKISDKVNDVKGEAKNITLQWHFPSDKAISIEGQEITVTSKSGNKLLISFEGSNPDDLSVVKGKKGEKVLSCISYKANNVEPSQSLRVLFKKRRSLEVITKLEFLLADEHIAPIHEPDLPNIQSSSSLSASLRNLEKPIRNSVVLGSSSSGIELAQLHRDFQLGGVKVLVNTTQQCTEAKARLKDQPLSPWITYAPLKLSSTTPIAINGDVFDSVAGVDLLVIVGSGFEEHELEKVILLSLPQLLDRMHKGGRVWVADNLPPKCKNLCEAIIQKYEVSLVFAVGLD